MAFSYWATATLRDACALDWPDWRPHQTAVATTVRARVKPGPLTEQAGRFTTRRSGGLSVRNAWEKRGPRCTNVGIGGDQLLLCLADVRTLHGADRREARRYGLDDWRCVQVTASRGWRGCLRARLPQKQSQRIFIQCPLAAAVPAWCRSLRQRFGLPVVELGRSTRIQPQFGQANRLFAGSQVRRDSSSSSSSASKFSHPLATGHQADLGRVRPSSATGTAQALVPGLKLATCRRVQFPTRSQPTQR